MNPILIAATLGDKIDSTFFGFDIWVFKFFGGIQNGFLTTVAKIFTSFGDENFVIPMAVLAVVLCFFKKTRKLGFSMLFAIAIGTIVTNVIVKPAVLRVRPYNTLQATSAWAEYSKWYIGAGALSESDYSFPSGHTTAAFELAVSVALCLREKGKKKLSWIPPVIAICTMGSRVYLMVHYASDVIGGLIVGTISGVLAFYLAKLACMIFEKVKFLDSIDAEKIVKKITKKDISPKAGTATILAATFIIFLIAFVPSLSSSDKPRCDYNVELSQQYGIEAEYNCYNEAKTDEKKYPELQEYKGKHFCKIHYKQLSGQTK